MTPLPPPQGMSEVDYETIEAAVTETVRGRWFLGEFARRNRAAELRQILDAVARLEGTVAKSSPALAPPADPSIRLLVQRIKEIAGQLDTLSGDMRDAGIDARFVTGVEHQAQAVAGMMRTPGRGALPPRPDASTAGAAAVPGAALPHPPASPPRLPRADLPPVLSRPMPPRETAGPPREAAATPREAAATPRESAGTDARKPSSDLAALSALDALTLAQKLALFS